MVTIGLLIVFKKLKINVKLLTDDDKRRQKAIDNEQNGVSIRTKNKTLFYDIWILRKLKGTYIII